MKSLLILTDALPPAFAPRMGYLIQYLCNRGYKVTAIAPALEGTLCNISVPEACVHSVSIPPKTGFGKALALAGDVFCNQTENHFYQQVKELIADQPFDVVLCSTYETFPLHTAKKIAQELNVPFWADLRDITEQFGTHYSQQRHPNLSYLAKLFSHLKMKRRNHLIRKATALSTVSPWHQQFLQKKHPQVHLLYNGYDPELFTYQEAKTDHFTVVYTGKLVNTEVSNPTLFIAAIEQLLSSEQLPAAEVKVDWYVPQECIAQIEFFLSAAKHTRLCSRIMEMVPATQVPTVLHQASVVLVLACPPTKNGPKGIMTTKFFEALGCEKPVLCVHSDEACLADAIKQTNAGLAAQNIDQIKDFLLEQYSQWKAQGCTRQTVNPAEKEKFSRLTIAKQWEELLNNIVP